jgi:hypothetical protein
MLDDPLKSTLHLRRVAPLGRDSKRRVEFIPKVDLKATAGLEDAG